MTTVLNYRKKSGTYSFNVLLQIIVLETIKKKNISAEELSPNRIKVPLKI